MNFRAAITTATSSRRLSAHKPWLTVFAHNIHARALFSGHGKRSANLLLLRLEQFCALSVVHHDAVQSALHVALLKFGAKSRNLFLRKHRLAVGQRLLRKSFERLRHRRQQGCVDFLLAPALSLHLAGLLP